ncbi:hypothetical protein BGX21_008689 [Mortierella sp. AD011]|nr:hypothetical protein BGX20_010205 [Mortierella sp. AD010]KAF9402793.1 hypothetical protein BGX21_008689 [Mortierella sp. AD011]
MLALNAPPGQGPTLHPFVHYRCMCSSPGQATKTSSEEQDASTTTTTADMDVEPLPQDATSTALIPTAATTQQGQEQDPKTQKTMAEIYASGNSSESHGSQSLSRLYFCDSCDEIRCSRCTQDEIVCYYCPNCLFDVPTASVKSEKHKCSRNCFECPLCQNTLSVVSEDPDAGQFAAATSAYGQYHLVCNVCHWNSQSINMTFEKPTGLAAQLQKAEESSPDVMEFGRLKEHLEKYFRVNSKPSISSSILSSIQSGSIQALRYVGSGHRPRSGDDIAHYVPAVQVMDDTESLDRLMSVTSLTQTTTMKQRLGHLQKQPYIPERLQPKRIHLRIKKSRRCRTCRHILVNPEQKAQSIRFKINLIALNQIPNITIANIQPMIAQTLSRVILRFTNPRHEEVHVSVKYGDGAQPHHGVTIRSPNFSISPFNEVWEYEVGAIGAAPGSMQEDVYEKTANSTSIAVDITPVAAGEVKIPLFVTFTFKTPKARESGSPQIGSQLVVSGTKDLPSLEYDYVDKTISFWTIIGFGDAVPTLAS